MHPSVVECSIYIWFLFVSHSEIYKLEMVSKRHTANIVWATAGYALRMHSLYVSFILYAVIYLFVHLVDLNCALFLSLSLSLFYSHPFIRCSNLFTRSHFNASDAYCIYQLPISTIGTAMKCTRILQRCACAPTISPFWFPSCSNSFSHIHTRAHVISLTLLCFRVLFLLSLRV